MSESPLADTRTLSVSIIAGPSRGALLKQIESIEEQRCLVLAAGATPHEAQHALEQISAIAERGQIEHLIIECDPHTPVMAYASLFESPSLTEIARLTKTVLAIGSSELVASLVRRGREADPTSSCFLAEQLEFASHIVLDGAAADPDLKLAREIALALNPRAQISDLSAEAITRLVDAPGSASFYFAAALDGAGWRLLIDEAERLHNREDRIKSFAYRARRPFHPERFWMLLQDGLTDVFRAKGFFWLATRMDLVGGLNLAGSELHCAAAGQWWAARDEHAREHEMPERTRREWQKPFGDRRQALAFFGLNFDPLVCKAQLDTCLLTDSELSAGPEKWAGLNDPFPSWAVHSHTHECHHDHESGDHECCHHH